MNFKLLLSASFLLFAFFSKGQFEKHLVGYYPFEEGKAIDYSKRGGKGKIYGNLRTIKGINGDALRFDGGNHNIVFKGKINRYLRGQRDFTISFYFRSDDMNQRSSLMGKRKRCKGIRMFDMRLSKGKIGAELYEKERPRISNNVSTIIPDRGWHHYVYVRRGNTVRIFVDGELTDKGQIRRIIPIDDLAYFAINASPCKRTDGTGNLVGAIDELKIFKVALTKKHIRYLFEQNPLPPLPARLKNISVRKRYPPNDEAKIAEPQPEFPLPKTLDEKFNDNPSGGRLATVFGKYEDAESKSALVLEEKKFILTIKNPEGYQADELIYTGKYKIEDGDLYLLRGEILLKNAAGEILQRVQYKEKIISDLFENEINMFAFETRMKLKK